MNPHNDESMFWSAARSAAITLALRAERDLDAALWPEVEPANVDGKALMRRIRGAVRRWAARIAVETVGSRGAFTPADAAIVRAAAEVTNTPRHRAALKLREALAASPAEPESREHVRRALAADLITACLGYLADALGAVEHMTPDEWSDLAESVDALHDEVPTPCAVSEAVVGGVCEAVASAAALPQNLPAATDLVRRCLNLHTMRTRFPGDPEGDRDRAAWVLRAATGRWLGILSLYAADRRRRVFAASAPQDLLTTYRSVLCPDGHPLTAKDVEDRMHWAQRIVPSSHACHAVASVAETLLGAMRDMEAPPEAFVQGHAKPATDAAVAFLRATAASDPVAWAFMADTIIADLDTTLSGHARRYAVATGRVAE